ncbi:SAM-dependent methyltransferase [Spirillospora sp. NPDC048911]|uniref:SAM-dependent methyltransferase n=1 Tax=Spirillospora sp. NPDC048911 TaxID=3364527 RepID=UPI003711A103
MSSFDETFDPTTPADARIYDYIIGGKDHYGPDRGVAEGLQEGPWGDDPERRPAVENRRFLRRAVRFLLDAGIRQFVDIGCGLPTRTNVHDLAHEADPAARVVYVDHDHVVVNHYRALLSSSSTATVIKADARRPDEILDRLRAAPLVDLQRPLGVLMVGLLHLIADEDEPAEAVARFRDAVVPGSYLALSHLTGEGQDPVHVAQFVEMFQSAREPMVMRPRARIRTFFDGLDLVEPGMVDAPDWRPNRAYPPPSGWLVAGVARKN